MWQLNGCSNLRIFRKITRFNRCRIVCSAFDTHLGAMSYGGQGEEVVCQVASLRSSSNIEESTVREASMKHLEQLVH